MIKVNEFEMKYKTHQKVI